MSNENIKENLDKRLMKTVTILMIFSLTFYIEIIIILVNLCKDELLAATGICITTILFVIEALFALKFESEVGYHVCKNCGNKFTPTFKQVFLALHIGHTRYLECPKCHKKSWAKKVMSK